MDYEATHDVTHWMHTSHIITCSSAPAGCQRACAQHRRARAGRQRARARQRGAQPASPGCPQRPGAGARHSRCVASLPLPRLCNITTDSVVAAYRTCLVRGKATNHAALAAPAGRLPLCAGCGGSVGAACTALKPCGRAGASFGKDVVRVNLGITNPASPSYTDSLVGVSVHAWASGHQPRELDGLPCAPAQRMCRPCSWRHLPSALWERHVHYDPGVSALEAVRPAIPDAARIWMHAGKARCSMRAALGPGAHGKRAARQGHTWSNAWAAYFSANTYSTYYDPTPVTAAAPPDDQFLFQTMYGPGSSMARLWAREVRSPLQTGRARAQAAGRCAGRHVSRHNGQ